MESATGIVIVDHGSRRAASNDMLLRVVDLFLDQNEASIVEPAHMELAEPSIDTAFGRCRARGAARIVVHPYFLLPGRHWSEDIPQLSAEAAARHGNIPFLVTAPLGLDPRMAQVIATRIEQCERHASGEDDACELCAGTDRCRWA